MLGELCSELVANAVGGAGHDGEGLGRCIAHVCTLHSSLLPVYPVAMRQSCVVSCGGFCGLNQDMSWMCEVVT